MVEWSWARRERARGTRSAPYTSKMTEPDYRARQPVNKGLGSGFLGAAAVMLCCWGVFDAAGFFGVEMLVGF